jgi:hypothetical protein
LESVIIEIISLAIHAKNKTGKSEILMLNKIDSLLKEFMIFLRIVEKTSILKTSGYAVLSEKTLEAGKILGGWIKNTKSDPL